MWQRRGACLVIATAIAVALAAGTLSGQVGGGGGRGEGPFQGGGRGGAAPVRDATNQAATGTGTITGVVVLEGAGTPIRRARVSLAGPELRGGRTATTDEQGRFSFAALPAGRFTLTASKAGFVDIAYGAKRAGRQGTPIQLADSQQIDRLTIAMPRGGVITGVVVDEYGEPAAGTQVRALRYVMRTGERTLVQAGQDQTDDRGMYRIYQLQPGDYIVTAVPRNTGANDLRQTVMAELSNLTQQLQIAGGRGGADGPFSLLGNRAGGPPGLQDRIAQLQQQLVEYDQQGTTMYAPVYYPGTTTATSALAVAINAGEERPGVDFRLQLVPTTRIAGIVTSGTGALPPATQVVLVPHRREGVPVVPGLVYNAARVGPDGRFVFNNVTPGEYRLEARANIRDAADGAAGMGRGRGGPQAGPIARVLWASTEVAITGYALPDIVLTLQEGMTISGRVEFQGSSPQNAPTGARVMLTSRGEQNFEMGGMPAAQTDASGRFVLTGVAPGRYTLTSTLATSGGGRGGRGFGGGVASATPAGQWTLQSAMVNGRDLLDFPIDIGPNQSLANVLLTYATRTQELSGTIQDTSGGPTSDFTIIVFPSDKQYWLPQARRIAATRPGTDGRFTFRGLPAGDYRLTAVTDVEPGEWYDPAFLSQIGAASIPITLSEGEQKVQDIRLAGG